MPSSYARVILHTIFSTKYRLDIIAPETEPSLYRFIGSRFAHHNSRLIRINGTANHLHLLHSLPRTVTIAKLMEDVKSLSSKWLKNQGEQYADFAWQDGYGTFSVDYRNMDGIIAYIDRQKEHHMQHEKSSFEQEFKLILDDYQCDYNPDYLFE